MLSEMHAFLMKPITKSVIEALKGVFQKLLRVSSCGKKVIALRIGPMTNCGKKPT